MQHPVYFNQPPPTIVPQWMAARQPANPRDPRLRVEVPAQNEASYFTDTLGRRIDELPSFLPPRPAVVEWVQEEPPARRVYHDLGLNRPAPVMSAPPQPVPVPVVAAVQPAPAPVVMAEPLPVVTVPKPVPVAEPPAALPEPVSPLEPMPMAEVRKVVEHVCSSQDLGQPHPPAEAVAESVPVEVSHPAPAEAVAESVPVAVSRPAPVPASAPKKRTISDVEIAEAFRPLPRRSCVGKPVKRYGFE